MGGLEIAPLADKIDLSAQQLAYAIEHVADVRSVQAKAVKI